MRPAAAAGRIEGSDRYGWVVESVNVSVLLYVPVRSASLAPTACENASVTLSLLFGPV